MTHLRSVVPWLTATLLGLLLAACGSSGGGSGPGDSQGDVTTPSPPVPLTSAAASATFELQNVSQRTLDWTISLDHDPDNPEPGDWFTIEPASGRLAPFDTQLVLLIQEEDIAPGTYHTTLSVGYEGGRSLFEVTGEVDPDEEWQRGDATIRGRISTPNSLIPLDPPANPGTAGAAAPASASTPLPGDEVVVVFEERFATLSAEAKESQLGALRAEPGVTEAVRRGDDRLIVKVAPGEDAEEVARRLSARPGVEFAEPNYRFELHAIPGDPLIDRAWHLPAVGAPVAWEWGPDDGLPVVAVIDNGFDLDHVDLRNAFVSGGYDFCGDENCRLDNDTTPDNPFLDTHGTHVTGLVAATADNGRGSAGVITSGARIVPVKAFYGTFTSAVAVADSIRWAAGGSVSGAPPNPDPAQIITLSLGATGDSRLVREAVEFAHDQGALLIASAGNAGERGIDYPAAYPQVVGVGAVNSSFERSCFSDYGEGLDIMAPGGDGFICNGPDEALLSTLPGDEFGNDRGTSMAAPLVAGAAALVWAQLDEPSNEAVRRDLERSAYFDSGYMSADRYGNGILRVDRALGLPGPGDTVTVQAVGPSTDLDTVTLDLVGSSSEFRLSDLAPGGYRLEVEAAGRTRSLTTEATLTLGADEDERLTVDLGR